MIFLELVSFLVFCYLYKCFVNNMNWKFSEKNKDMDGEFRYL